MRTNADEVAKSPPKKRFDTPQNLAVWLACAVLFAVLIGFAENWVWIFPRAAAIRLAGLELPQSARFQQFYGNGREKVYIWKVAGEDLVELKLPARGIFGSEQWASGEARPFGGFDPKSIPGGNFEILQYDVPFWHVALYRDVGASQLVISAVAEKLDE